MFEPVPSDVDFVAMEHRLLKFWKETRAFEKLVAKNRGRPRWSFLDGPITANNPMGVHHAWGRTYKDLFQRYHAMRGSDQRFQNGFDCQGLWIEVEVERELGFKSKRDIEAYGIARFVERCKERALRFSRVQTEQSIRLGYWMDWDNSYYTMSDENNYTIWLFLRKCHDRGLIYRGHDVMPWCPRCATGISQHEIVTEGYREVTHTAVYLKFPLCDRPGESLLVWTTTPWTLTSNVAAAVHPDLTYVKVRQGGDVFYVSKGALAQAVQGSHEVLEELPGSRLVRLRYTGPFDELPAERGVEHRVVPWTEVSEAEGTGIVHIAPGAGQEDLQLGREHGLATIAPLDEFGVFVDGFGWLSGKHVYEVAQPIVEDLRRKGLLYRAEEYTHRYPVCWRCGNELVFRLVDEWFISMDYARRPDAPEARPTRLRDEIMDVARRIRWMPDWGLDRELDWLRNMDDWMISKKRYYGLALPIWVCQACDQFEVIGSETELRERAVEGWEEFEGHSPHRPWVDAVKIACPKCGGRASRIPDVGNPWLDAGIVPFSTLGYRHNRPYWEEWYPADFITESFPGQFRNWFYSLLAMSTVLQHREPFKTVLGHAQVNDERGQEMHKSSGNMIEFNEAAERVGASVMRWMYAAQNPELNVSFGWGPLEDVKRRLLTLWNVYAFFSTYARLDGFDPTQQSLPVSERPALDRWILSELHLLVDEVTRRLDDFDAMTVTRRVEAFVEDLSTWYVRRGRRRYWKSEADQDKLAAYLTLHEVLVALAKVIAPIMPFLAEEMYQNLVRSVDAAAPESVHHCDWPAADLPAVDRDLLDAMSLVRRVVGLGRAARSKARLKVRQPAQALLVKVKTAQERAQLESLADLVTDELNVKRLEFAEQVGDLVSYRVRPQFAALGPAFGPRSQQVARALQAADARALLRAQATHEPLRLALGGEEVEVPLNGFAVESVDRPGFAVAEDAGYVAALDTRLTLELVREGLARELAHRLNGMRRTAGFDLSDRIAITVDGASPEVQAVFADHGSYIQQEALATRIEHGSPPPSAYREHLRVDGHEVTLGVQRVTQARP